MFFCILSLLSLSVWGQTRQGGAERKRAGITGTLVEMPRQKPLGYATVRLLSRRDSSLVKGTTSNDSGVFSFSEVPVGRYLLHITFVGFKDTYQPIQMNAEAPIFQVGTIRVQENSIALKEAVVVGQKAEMVVKQDTVEFNAGAYKMQESAVAEDLLKRIPGVEVSETGKITVQGKEVKKILVDGKDFFKGDPTMATKNIPVEIMDKLQVIDDKSELSKLTGINDGEEETVINITVKKGMKKGWIINASGGLGSEFDRLADPLRYEVNGFATRMVDDTQLGIVMNGNNINNQRFTGRGGGSSTGSGGSFSSRGGLGGSAGVNTSFSTGLTFAQEKGKNFKQGGDVTYGYSEKDVQQKSFRQNMLPDSVSYQKDTTRSWNRSHDIQANYKLEWKPSEQWLVQVVPSASYSRGDSWSDGRTRTLAGDRDSSLVNRSAKTTTSLSDNLNVGTTLSVAKEFNKPGRKLSVSLDARYSLTQTNGTNLSENIFLLNPSKNKSYNQQSNNANNSFNTRLFLSYVEPLGNNNFLQASYWVRYNTRDNIRNTYEWRKQTQAYDSLSPDFSKSISNDVLTQRLSASFRSVREKYNYTVGLDFTPAFTRSQRYVQGGNPDGSDLLLPNPKPDGYATYNFAPNVDFTYKFNETKNLKIEYRGRSETPSITQLDPTEDVTNPLNIRSGNAELLPTFTQSLRLRYSDFDRKNQRSFMTMLYANYVLDDIVNETTYEQGTGVRRTKPVNVSGSWNGTFMLMFNRPIGNMFQINNYTNVSLRNTIGRTYLPATYQTIDEQALTASFSENLGVTFRKDWIYMQLRGDFALSNTDYSTEGKKDQLTTNYGALFSFQFTLPHTIGLGSDIRYRGVWGYSEGYNQGQLLWNAEISKMFLKNNAATVRLRVNDILRQQLNITRTVASNYFEDTEYNTLTSYFMLSLAYRFNSMGNKRSGSDPRSIDYRPEPPAGHRRYGGASGGGMDRP